ncbi:MAG TPA: efflux RND transporter periplasmic adaptor subunit [Anaeromyxobacteraceae bacterium]|nr:efflux RND transporter periplasmic adaptor subunit [Anaeromyxobacteraceae bacterium]
MKKRRLVVVAASVAALLLAVVGWRLARRPKAPTFETVAADRGPVVARVTASGTLSALVTVQVGSQVSGRIQSVLVDFNSRVKRGQLIARIDPQLFEAAVQQARANLAAANGNLVRAQAQAVDADRQAKRQRALADQKLVAVGDAETAESTADAARAAVAAAQGSVEQAKAALNQAQVNLGYTQIVSPTDGVVISRNVDVGQTVAASLQVATLFTIAEDLRRMQVDTSVSEADVGKLRDGMEATFTVDAFPGERFVGKVRQVRNAATTVQNVVTYDAVIDVANPDLKLRPGMTANVAFVWADRRDALRVPNAALRFRPPADLVAPRGAAAARKGNDASAAPGAAPRAEGGDASRRVVWRLVAGKPQPTSLQVGVTDGTVTEVLSGELSPGDACIVDVDGKGAGGGAGGRPPRMF